MKRWISAAACLMMAGFLSTMVGTAAAKDFPSRTIKVVHGSNPGAPQDIMMRVLADEITKIMESSVVVEPRPGGTSTVAVSHMMGQAPDGHTIFLGGSGIIQSLQMPSSPYPIDQMQPVYRAQLDPFALYIKRDGKYAGMEDLVAAMKANPGKVRIGGFGTGSGQNLAALAWAEAVGVELTWVPYDSGSKAITAVMGDNLDAAMSNIGVYRRFKDKVSVAGVSTAERIEVFPDVPTFKEQNADVVRTHWRAMFARKGTPKEVVQALHDAIGKAVKSEPYQQYLEKSGTLDGSMSVEEFEAWFAEQGADGLAQMKRHGFLN